MELRNLFGCLAGALAMVLVGSAPGIALAEPGRSDTIEPFIVGGETATSSYPFIASLQTTDGRHFCGGSLVSQRWVVTAVHCVVGQSGGTISASQVRLRVGSHDRSSGGSYVGVSHIIAHQNYSGQVGPNDVAVIRLSQSVSQQPIEMSSSSPSPGTSTRLLGWGQACPQPKCDGGPRYLKQLDTQITYDANCQGAGIDGSSELCVAATTQDTACYGDSGGPALLNSSGRWLLTGATSRSGGTNSTCGADGSVIYTDVAAHRNWISYYLQF